MNLDAMKARAEGHLKCKDSYDAPGEAIEDLARDCLALVRECQRAKSSVYRETDKCEGALVALWDAVVKPTNPGIGEFSTPSEAYRKILAEFAKSEAYAKRLQDEIFSKERSLNLYDSRPVGC